MAHSKASINFAKYFSLNLFLIKEMILGIFSCWVLSSAATRGSLFFSEVMGFPPCSVCWYQRIAMYPLVVLFLIGIKPINKDVFKYTFPIVSIGWLLALYHNLLHLGLIPEKASPCRFGVPCSSVWIKWLGFITIPFLSLVTFSILLILLTIFYKKYYRLKIKKLSSYLWEYFSFLLFHRLLHF